MKIKSILFFLILAFPIFSQAGQLGELTNFFINPDYDLYQREETSATLKVISQKAYFWIDNYWWEFLSEGERIEFLKILTSLGEEFDNKIYPTLVFYFGSEWKPGIDGDERIHVLFHPMKKEAGGYFNSGDEYSKLENPKSNQKEMVYLNSNHLESPRLKSFLAHEFSHLITFNQKERLRGISEEVWLNEARAEYAPTLLGYDDEKETNLENRIKEFLKNPNDSITAWEEKPADYGALSLFTQYLVERFGKEILIDSLRSKEKGIASINQALKEYGLKESFSDVFRDWAITVLVNDCSLGERYCYRNKNLVNLRILPKTVFLPLSGESSLFSQGWTRNWAGNWIRFIGGSEDLKIEFNGMGNFFQVPYLTQDRSGNFKLSYFILNEKQKGEILIPNFRTEIVSVTIIPILQNKISDFDNSIYPFSYRASIVKHQERKEELIKELLAQIEFLKVEINRVQSQINAILATQRPSVCQNFEHNLYFGMRQNPEVRCLQEFLKAQGPEIYPEGLVTGNFLTLTKLAVIRFQEKHASEILAPLGLKRGTGYVGPMTRTKINQLLKKFDNEGKRI